MRIYETTFILDPQNTEEDWNTSVEKYSGIITNGGGTIHRCDVWGQRRLAYQLKKQNRGYYVHIVHESPPDIPLSLSRQFSLDESCWRFLTVQGKLASPEEPKEESERSDRASSSIDDSDDKGAGDDGGDESSSDDDSSDDDRD